MIRLIYIVPFLMLSAAWIVPQSVRPAVALQSVRPAVTPQSVQPAVAPAHLKTTWGGQTGGSIDTNTARTVLTAPLAVTDDKGGTYILTHFRFSYRQKSLFQDSSGKVDSTTRLFTRVYYNTPTIDTLWRNVIAGEVQPGEAFIIDNIIVKDARGTKALAPDLELDIR